MTELVSIIMPAYNSGKYIKYSIESVINQTYYNWELIIVNDFSTDNTEKIVKEYTIDSRIIYVPLTKNLGVANARNTGVELSKGVYIAFLDSDDAWHKEKLQIQYDFMKNNNSYFSFTAYRYINESNELLKKEIRYNKESVNYKRLLKGSVIGCLTVMINIKKIGLFKMPIISHEDYATWLNIIKKHGPADYLDNILGFYRVHQNSTSSNKKKAIKWMWNIYRNQENLSVLKSFYYLVHYMIRGFIKHYL